MAEINTTLQLLRELQAELRTLRGELKPIRENYVTRADMFHMITVMTDRFAEFEAHIDRRLDGSVR
jgi:hypothetical protein